jgi:hypothetical protein
MMPNSSLQQRGAGNETAEAEERRIEVPMADLMDGDCWYDQREIDEIMRELVHDAKRNCRTCRASDKPTTTFTRGANQYEGVCVGCNGTVKAGGGVRFRLANSWRVAHHGCLKEKQ